MRLIQATLHSSPASRALTTAMAILAFSAYSTDTQAQSIEVDGGISTLGLTAGVSYRLNDQWRIRGMIAGVGSYRTDLDSLDLDYAASATGTATASFNSLGVMAQYDLNDAGLFLGGGLLFMDFDANATATGTITLDSGTSANTTVDATIGFENKIAPIVSLGYSGPIDNKWSFYGEVGAALVGGVEATLVETGGNFFSATELQQEADKVENDIDLNVYPYISLGVQFQF